MYFRQLNDLDHFQKNKTFHKKCLIKLNLNFFNYKFCLNGCISFVNLRSTYCEVNVFFLNSYLISLPLIFKIRFLMVSAILSFFNSHSQTVITFQPRCFNSSFYIISLSLVLLILFIQKSVLVFGSTKYLHPSCPCQKHPLTKIIVLYFLKIISGFPGSFLLFKEYRKPSLN